MLGAQALRTKQKAEQKEREKRQRERQRNLELQRERIQKAASEEAAMQLQMQMQEQVANGSQLFPNSQMPIGVPVKQRHSVHSTALSSHLLPLNAQIQQNQNIQIHQRSPSADCGKPDESNHSAGSRFMKWLGFSSSSSSSTNTNNVRKQQRRMSTY